MQKADTTVGAETVIVEQEETARGMLAAAGMAPDGEAALLEQVRRGDADAEHRLVREYYPGVYRYLLYLTGRPEMAEDLTQETFLQAWRHLDAFEGRASLRTWLHRIAHREFLQFLRRRRPEASLEEVTETGEPRDAAWTDAVELRELIRRLPLEEREVMILHYLEGYTSAEIAQIVRAPAGTVRYRLAGARSHLQREIGDGDLVYLNEQSVVMRRWAWLPLEQMSALEARLSLSRRCAAEAAGSISKRATADTDAGPPAVGQREADVVDSRLTRRVTLAFKATALSDLCEHLTAETGISLTAGRSVADEKVTLFCKNMPLREVMRQLSRPFGYAWTRSQKEDQYRYELMQDLRSQLLEEELRNRDRNTALLALEREIERYRPYLDLSPDEALARAKTAPPEEKRLLEKLAGYGWGAIQMYFRLTPQQHAGLRAGEPMKYRQEPQPGTLPLPADVARGVLQSLRDVFFYRGPDGFGLALGVQELAPDHVAPTALPEARASVSLSIRETELGRIALMYDAGTFSHSDLSNSGGSWRQGDGTLAVGTSPAVVKPDNRAANARLAADPALRRRVSVKPEGRCGADLSPGPSPARGGEAESGESPRRTDRLSSPSPFRGGAGGGVLSKAKVTTADVLEALHRVTGLPIVSDFYTRLYEPASLTATDQPLFDALNRLADAMHLRWSKDGEWLQFRGASFYHDRIKEVPNRLLSRWAESRRQRGILPLDDLVEIAGLSDAQLDAAGMAEGARDCWGLAEWQLARSETLRPDLRFLAELSSTQRQEAMSPSGLAFTKLSLPQQQRYMALALRFDDRPLQSLEELEGAVLRVEYTQPGGFQWRPPASNSYRWVAPLVPGLEGRRALMPPVRGRTGEEARAAARRLAPCLLEALLPAARRVSSGIQSPQGVAEAGEIAPTELGLWIVYIPGLSNRRNILIVDRQSTSYLSSR